MKPHWPVRRYFIPIYLAEESPGVCEFKNWTTGRNFAIHIFPCELKPSNLNWINSTTCTNSEQAPIDIRVTGQKWSITIIRYILKDSSRQHSWTTATDLWGSPPGLVDEYLFACRLDRHFLWNASLWPSAAMLEIDRSRVCSARSYKEKFHFLTCCVQQRRKEACSRRGIAP